MSDEDPGDARLAALAARERPPAAKLAASLQEASRHDLVHVDRKGQVRSPARFRLLQYGAYGLMVGIVGGATVLYYAILGPAGVGVGAALGLWYGAIARHNLVLRRGLELLVADRIDEAAASLGGLLSAPLVPRRVRAAAEQNLGICRMIGGRYDEALALHRSAIARWGRSRSPLLPMARHGEVYALVNLGRLPEARERFTALGPPPEGDYLKVHHWSVELYLALAEGKHLLAETELYLRARVALGITTAAGLLGLLAWAYDRSGDRDMSQHLLRECLDRHLGPRLSGCMPLLQRWLDGAGRPE
jgi:hypothetical protein